MAVAIQPVLRPSYNPYYGRVTMCITAVVHQLKFQNIITFLSSTQQQKERIKVGIKNKGMCKAKL